MIKTAESNRLATHAEHPHQLPISRMTYGIIWENENADAVD